MITQYVALVEASTSSHFVLVRLTSPLPTMRLLHTSSLALHDFFDETIPPYGILSHTWVEGQEVSYQEMSNLSRSVKKRSGYRKIINCAEEMKDLGYDFVWIDICSIDKSSSAELSESINSMYRWYRHSKTCLVFMADVFPTAPRSYHTDDKTVAFGSNRYLNK